jgi:hypothetical protein
MAADGRHNPPGTTETFRFEVGSLRAWRDSPFVFLPVRLFPQMGCTCGVFLWYYNVYSKFSCTRRKSEPSYGGLLDELLPKTVLILAVYRFCLSTQRLKVGQRKQAAEGQHLCCRQERFGRKSMSSRRTQDTFPYSLSRNACFPLVCNADVACFLCPTFNLWAHSRCFANHEKTTIVSNKVQIQSLSRPPLW